jgi:beta-barrel assembly-enhancing protease
MRRQSLLVACMALLALFAGPAPSQSSQDTANSIRKEFVLGKGVVRDLGPADRSISDSTIVAYVQAIQDRLARAAGARPLKVRISRGSNIYASLLSNGEIYISGALLERIDNEAELAGLLAHQLAHELRSTVPASRPTCALASRGVPYRWTDERREFELEATKTAVNILNSAGYEPSAVLDLFSKLAYEHPEWAEAIVPDDLLNLRAIVESGVPPEAGYVIDSSNFVQYHAKISKILGHGADTSTAPHLASSPNN